MSERIIDRRIPPEGIRVTLTTACGCRRTLTRQDVPGVLVVPIKLTLDGASGYQDARSPLSTEVVKDHRRFRLVSIDDQPDPDGNPWVIYTIAAHYREIR
jgi:hypothetical protein